MKQLFPVTKTLAFNLIPVGKTLENINSSDVIKNGKELHKHYLAMKEVADDIHKDFIEKVLSGFRFKYLSDGGQDSVQEYAEAFFSTVLKPDEKGEILREISSALKKQIGDAFRNEQYDGKTGTLKALASKALLSEFIAGRRDRLSAEQMEAFETMSRYTTYMRPYFEIRNRMYDDACKGHTIPVRFIDDNLPIHLGNVSVSKDIPAEVFDAFNGDEYFASFLRSSTPAMDIRDVFTVSYGCVIGAQSAIDVYNALIGGVSIDYNIRHKGLNELINEYNQQHNAEVRQFKKLKKQILSDMDTFSWIPESLENDEQVLSLVKEINHRLYGMMSQYGLLYSDPDKSRTFIRMRDLSCYSHEVYGSWYSIKRALYEQLRRDNPKSSRMSDEGYSKKIEKLFKAIKYISVEDIEKAASLAGTEPKKSLKEFLHDGVNNNITSALGEYMKLNGVTHLESELILKEKLGQSKADGKQGAGAFVKTFLDYVNDAVNVARMFTDEEGELDYDIAFYEDVIFPLAEFADSFVPAYNSIRNYLTKKPYSKDKIELTFDNPNLLNGWDLDKLPDNRGVIFREGEDFYLGILGPLSKKLFSGEEHLDEGSAFQMLTGKALKAANMTLPKVAFAKCNEELYHPSQGVLSLYNSKKPVADYTGEEVAMMIDFYKGVIAATGRWDILGFQFKETKEYKRLSEFYEDFDEQSYNMGYMGVSKGFVMEAMDKGELFLFRISCQDMLEKHHGKDGDYKILLNEALSGKKGALVRLCGGAAVYYRKASLTKTVTHPAGVPIANKNPDNPSRTRTLPYDLYKDRRYMEDRFMFHLPVTVYPRANGRGAMTVTREVRDIIRKEPGMFVLGINRGERNLITIAVTAPNGRIVEQRHFNVFDNYDYRAALAQREKERTDDRINWNAVRDIKNIKKGYLSRVVGEITRLVKRYGCVVAMENLDLAFKNDRQAFEKNVYQQFERDLVKKLSLLMDKDETEERIANAMQLCNPCETEAERTQYPQNGILFFVNPSWITRTDPLTGFVNRLNPHYSSVAESEAFMESMDGFRFDADKGRFVLSFRYGKAAPGKEAGNPDRRWEVETYGERIENILETDKNTKGEWVDKVTDLAVSMKKLMDEHCIAFEDGEDLIRRMKGKSAAFWIEFFRLLRLTLQNTSWNSKTREYRVIGCTSKDGRFYDSRNALESMPKDADVNAAWNIARKTHLALRHIRDFVPGETLDANGKIAKGPSTFISDAEWMDFAQK